MSATTSALHQGYKRGPWQPPEQSPEAPPPDGWVAAGQAHPSRSAVKCTDCKHLVPVAYGHPLCNHPTTPVDLVTGLQQIMARTMRAQGTTVRALGGVACGPSGSLFEAALKRLDQDVGRVVSQEALVDRRAGAQEGAQQLGVGFGIPVAQPLINLGDSEVNPASNSGDGVDFQGFHGSSPCVDGADSPDGTCIKTDLGEH